MSKQLLSYNFLKIKTLIRYLFTRYSKVYVSNTLVNEMSEYH